MINQYNVKAPALPLPPPEYQQIQQDQFQNALRLYFNRLDGFLSGLSTGTGGAAIKFPYFAGYQDGSTTLTANMTNVSTTPIQVTSTAGFESSGFLIIENEIIQYTTKTATTFDGTITRGVKGTTNVAHTAGVSVNEAAAVTSTTSDAMKIDAVTFSNGITCTVPDSKIYFDNPGLYNTQFSCQLLNYTNVEDNVTVWFKKNNVDVPYSASIQQVNSKHGSNPGATILALNFVDSFDIGDYVELYWASGTGNTVLATYPAGTAPVHPVSPSLILTVTFVSAV